MEKFKVFKFYPDETWDEASDWVEAEPAVRRAKELADNPKDDHGPIVRVIITDVGDECVFEWITGQGVVFPPRDEGVDADQGQNQEQVHGS